MSSEIQKPVEIEGTLAHAPDAFHPFLVKELRKVLKGRGFLLGLAIFLVLMSLCSFLMIAESKARGRVDNELWIWIIFIQTVYFLFVIPVLTGQSDDRDRDDSLLDLLRMTTLKPLNMVFGRWFTALFFVMTFGAMMVPYYFLRYFLGNYNVADGLIIFGVTLLLSLVVSAWMIASNYIFSKRFRGVLNVPLFVFAFSAIPQYVFSRRFGVINVEIWPILTLCLLLCLCIPFLLALGANAMALPVQRNAFWVRIPCLLFVVVSGVASVVFGEEGYWAMASLAVLVGFALILLEEPVLPSEWVLSRSLAKKRPNFIHKSLSYPGLGYGLFIWVLTLAGPMLSLPFIKISSKGGLEELFMILVWFGAAITLLFFSYLVALLFMRKFGYTASLTLGLATCISLNVLVLFVGIALDSLGIIPIDLFSGWSPLYVLGKPDDVSEDVRAYIVMAYSIFALVGIIITAMRERKRLRKEEARVLEV